MTEPLLDLASGVNPYPHSIPSALLQADFSGYSDAEHGLLREMLAEWHGLAPEEVFVDNGASAIIETLIGGALGDAGPVAVPAPGFWLYEDAARRHGRGVVRIGRFGTEKGTGPARPGLRFLTVPCPFGAPSPAQGDLERMIAEAPETRTVLDLGLDEYARHPLDRARLVRSGAICLGTFSKAYGLAGYRVGYALASADAVALLERRRGPFAVSRFSLAMAVQAMADGVFLRRSVVTNRAAQAGAAMAFRAVRETDSNRYLVLSLDAPGLARRFAEKGMRVRDLSAHGVSAILVATHLPHVNARAIEVLQDSMALLDRSAPSSRFR